MVLARQLPPPVCMPVIILDVQRAGAQGVGNAVEHLLVCFAAAAVGVLLEKGGRLNQDAVRHHALVGVAEPRPDVNHVRDARVSRRVCHRAQRAAQAGMHLHPRPGVDMDRQRHTQQLDHLRVAQIVTRVGWPTAERVVVWAAGRTDGRWCCVREGGRAEAARRATTVAGHTSAVAVVAAAAAAVVHVLVANDAGAQEAGRLRPNEEAEDLVRRRAHALHQDVRPLGLWQLHVKGRVMHGARGVGRGVGGECVCFVGACMC